MKASIGRRGLLLGASLAAVIVRACRGDRPDRPPTQLEAPVSNILDEITVSAQRRDQNKQDVPVTVTVLGGQLIEQARIQSVQDVGPTRLDCSSTPIRPASRACRSGQCVARTAGSRRSQPARRSWTKCDMAALQAINFESFDLQRIEVLKAAAGHPLRPERGRRRGEHRHQPPRSRPFRRRRRRPARQFRQPRPVRVRQRRPGRRQGGPAWAQDCTPTTATSIGSSTA